MCGIAGWIGKVENPAGLAAALDRALAHRGPDDAGARHWEDAALVFRRLSVLDLTKAGAQPMSNEDGSVWVVFNGEIYNHGDLRRELLAKGHVFRGRSDTEVLPHLYEEYGQQMFAHLRGMFAVAIYDVRNRRLLAARDRFGIKPLFYSHTRTGLFFASELNALRLTPGFDGTPDRQAISDYVALSYIPAPETFYRGGLALLPGEMIEVNLERDQARTSTHAFHSWHLDVDFDMTLQDASARAEELVSTAVQRQLKSDVPLGALLSGGIDSSLVSAAAQGASPDSIRTFNVRFPEAAYDETWAALAVAHHIKSDHTTFVLDSDSWSWERIVDLFIHAGQPYADSSLLAVSALSRFMRGQVTVALSGDGGDEGFGGYDSYWRIGSVLQWQRLPATLRPVVVGAADALAWLGLAPEAASRAMRELGTASHDEILASLYSWVRPAEHRSLVRAADVEPVGRLFHRTWENNLPDANPLGQLSAHTTEINVRLTLPNDYLFKVDIGSMKEALEIRVPMLDEDLFQFGLSLPHRLKVRGRTAKQVLRAVATRRLPAEVAKKRKWGFSVPVDRWLDTQFRSNLREYILDRSSPLPEFLNPEAYEPIVNAFAEGRKLPSMSRAGLYTRALLLLSLQLHLSAAGRRSVQTAA